MHSFLPLCCFCFLIFYVSQSFSHFINLNTVLSYSYFCFFFILFSFHFDIFSTFFLHFFSQLLSLYCCPFWDMSITTRIYVSMWGLTFISYSVFPTYSTFFFLLFSIVVTFVLTTDTGPIAFIFIAFPVFFYFSSLFTVLDQLSTHFLLLQKNQISILKSCCEIFIKQHLIFISLSTHNVKYC